MTCQIEIIFQKLRIIFGPLKSLLSRFYHFEVYFERILEDFYLKCRKKRAEVVLDQQVLIHSVIKETISFPIKGTESIKRFAFPLRECPETF